MAPRTVPNNASRILLIQKIVAIVLIVATFTLIAVLNYTALKASWHDTYVSSNDQEFGGVTADFYNTLLLIVALSVITGIVLALRKRTAAVIAGFIILILPAVLVLGLTVHDGSQFMSKTKSNQVEDYHTKYCRTHGDYCVRMVDN